MSAAYQGWLIPEDCLESPQFRAIMQLIVGVEQGHPQIKAYAAKARAAVESADGLLVVEEPR